VPRLTAWLGQDSKMRVVVVGASEVGEAVVESLHEAA
jgi:hypothetical protein